MFSEVIGMACRRPVEPEEAMPRDRPIRCRQCLGGLLKSYYRDAA